MNKLTNGSHIESRDELRNFVLASGSVMFGMGLKLALTFMTGAIAARILLPEGYGLLTWGLFFVNVLSIVTGLGLNGAAKRFIPIFQSRDDPGSVRGTVLSVTTISLVFGLVGTVLLLLGAGWLSESIFGDEREAAILLVLAFSLPLWNIIRVTVGVFGGFKLPLHKVLIEDLLVPGGFLVVILLAWALDWKETEIALGYVLVYLITVLLAIVLVRRKTPYSPSRHVKPRFHTRELLHFSWPLMFTEVLGKNSGLLTILIIGIFVSSNDVGIYRTASDLAAGMSLMLVILSFMYLPMIAEFSASGKHESWKELNARVARWSMMASFPIFVALFFFPNEIIQTIYGPEYAQGAPVLRILALAFFGHTMVGFTGLNLLAVGMTKTQLSSHLVSFAINFAIIVLLVPRYGIQGAAVATLISVWLRNGMLIFIMNRRLGIHPFTRSYLQALGPLLLIIVLGLILSQLDGFPSNILHLPLFLLVSLGIVLILRNKLSLFDEADIDLAKSFIGKLMPKVQQKSRDLS